MTATADDLVARVEALAVKAKAKRAPQRESEPALAAWNPAAMFDINHYGGRRCGRCKSSIDSHRVDAVYCSDACRSLAKRSRDKGPRPIA